MKNEKDEALRTGKAIKVLVVVGSLDVGGTERHIVQIMPQLVRCNITPLVYTLTHSGPLAPNLTSLGVEVAAPRSSWPAERGRIFKGLLLLASLFGLWRFLRREKPDIVHFFLPMAYLLGGFCGLVAGCRKLVMSRRSLNLYQKRHPVLALVEMKMHQQMTRITGNSRAVISDLITEGVPQDRLRLIYNGIELSSPESGRTKESVRTQLGISGGALVFILVANLIPYKGHADLLHALGMVRGQLPRPWKLLCVGRDNGLQDSLVQLSHNLQIADSVVFLGQRSDVADLFAAADIGLLCSHEEGFSNSILEGMAAGLPMVVTDVGGNYEAVVDGMTGLVVPPYSPDRFGAAIVFLANNLPLRHKMGMAAQKRVKEEFSLAGCVQRYADLYEEIMG